MVMPYERPLQSVLLKELSRPTPVILAAWGNLADGLFMFKVQPQDFFDFAHG
jgi:hypothetical protein